MENKRKKTGGRKKGSPNRTTKELKTLVTQFISGNWDQVQKNFDSRKIRPIDRLIFMERLLKYVLPTMSTTKGSLDIKPDLEKLSDEDLDKIITKLTEVAK